MKELFKLGFIFLIAFLTGCNKEKPFFIDVQPRPVLYAFGVSGQQLSARLTWTVPVKPGEKKTGIDHAILVLYENDIPIDTLVRLDSINFISTKIVLPGNKYSISGVGKGFKFYTDNELMPVPPHIDTTKTDLKYYSSPVYKVCLDNPDNSNQVIYKGEKYNGFDTYSFFGRMNSFSQLSTDDNSKNEIRCFLVPFSPSTIYFGSVNPALDKFISSLNIYDGSTDLILLGNRQAYSNVIGGYGILGLFASDSLIIK